MWLHGCGQLNLSRPWIISFASMEKEAEVNLIKMQLKEKSLMIKRVKS